MTSWTAVFAARVGSTLEYLRGRATSAHDRGPPILALYVPYFAAMSINHGLGLLRARSRGLPGTRMAFYPSRIALLRAAASAARPDGLWLEFGVFEGKTINALAGLTERTVHGFDSFEGLPGRWGVHFPAGRFRLAGRLPRVPANVRLWPGWFSDTIPSFLRDNEGSTVSLLHVDCDLYTSARDVLHGLHEHIVPGSVVVFDEFITPYPDDESRAFREFLRETGHDVEYLGWSRDGSVAVRVLSGAA